MRKRCRVPCSCVHLRSVIDHGPGRDRCPGGHRHVRADRGDAPGVRPVRLRADVRARAGMFLSFQEPLEVPGLSLESFLRSAMRQQTGKNLKIWEFHKQLKKAMDILQMDESYAQRSLNVGFSGGEKKKSEILQLMLLNPSLAILDETDSGLDVDAVRLVSKGVEEYQKNQNGALLIITHSTRILDALHVDYTHIMVDGKIVATGDGSLVDKINQEGYESFIREAGVADARN